MPRKGAVVSPITAKDVREFYAIKSLLEGYAARQACAKFTDKDIKRLRTLNQQMKTCAEGNDLKGFFRLDSQFHETFLKACNNDRLCTLAHNVVQQFERLPHSGPLDAGQTPRVGQAARRHHRGVRA